MLEDKKIYSWADEQFDKTITYDAGFNQLLSNRPLCISKEKYSDLNERVKLIHQFQDICISLFREALTSDDDELLDWLLNETPLSFSKNYHKKLEDRHYSKPVFFRTDEMSLGRIVEIQCPGSLWGELQFLYHFYDNLDYCIGVISPAELFSQQLKDYLGKGPIIHYLTDNASIPSGVRYFIQQTRPYIKYYGIDKEIRTYDCNFIRTHSFFGLCGENNFKVRLQQNEEQIKYDYPPNVLFDQKATLVLPFWNRTRNYFSDSIRNIFAYSIPITSNKLILEDGVTLSLEEFSKLPQSKRRYYVKYAGSDVSINWGSKAVYRLSNLGSEKCLKLLQNCLKDYKGKRIWLMQKEYTESRKIEFWDRDSVLTREKMNCKYSCFYGPYGLIGIIPSFRKFFKVHGQPDTVISIMLQNNSSVVGENS